jgi:hypothetical protein
VLSIAELPDWAVLGFHGLEVCNGEQFRWGGRVAALRFALPPGRHRLRIVTHGLRRDDPRLRVALNGCAIEPVPVSGGGYEIAIEPWHCHPREQTLILATKPLCPWKQGVKDYRELGLPLFGIEVLSSSVADRAPQREAA